MVLMIYIVTMLLYILSIYRNGSVYTEMVIYRNVYISGVNITPDILTIQLEYIWLKYGNNINLSLFTFIKSLNLKLSVVIGKVLIYINLFLILSYWTDI